MVEGAKPERWVRQTNFDNEEAVGYLADRLARLGVEEALAKAGRRARCAGAHRRSSSSTGSRRSTPGRTSLPGNGAPTTGWRTDSPGRPRRSGSPRARHGGSGP